MQAFLILRYGKPCNMQIIKFLFLGGNIYIIVKKKETNVVTDNMCTMYIEYLRYFDGNISIFFCNIR